MRTFDSLNIYSELEGEYNCFCMLCNGHYSIPKNKLTIYCEKISNKKYGKRYRPTKRYYSEIFCKNCRTNDIKEKGKTYLSSLHWQTIKVLEDLGIDSYEVEKSFEDLMGRNKELRYDFCIEKDGKTYLIECNGVQHYEAVKFNEKETLKQRKENLNKQKEYDKKKREYAKEHGYVFVEISYLYNYSEEKSLLKRVFGIKD